MAAAEYFSNTPMQPASHPYQQQAPTSYPQNQSIPQIQMQQAPPSYQSHNPQQSTVHFAPTPGELPQRHSFSGQHRPSFASQNGWQTSTHQNPYQQQNMALQPYPQRQHGSSHSTGYSSPSHRPQHLTPHMRPYAQPNSSQYSLEQGYSSDPEPHRRKHKHKKRRESDEKRSGKSRSANTDAFLGAAGGGLIGDLIFPGLGTVGGAALGYFGGKDYAKHRKTREDKRAVDQREWEEKYRPGLNSRDRSRDHGSRERDRRRSNDRRGDDY